MPETARYKASYYTRAVPYGGSTLLFNGVTSGLLRLPADLSALITPFLGPPRSSDAGRGLSQWEPRGFTVDELPPRVQRLFEQLVQARMFVPEDEDELDYLRRRTELYKKNDPFLVTITTTMDCNFDCYYCYEDKSPTYLSQDRCDEILDWIRAQVDAKGHSKLYTDWYGGEPMMNRDAIEYFSKKAIAYCEQSGIGYSSAMISNGTHWPDDAPAFVKRNRIRHVQLTMDGPPRHHNRRRGYKKGHEQTTPSFDVVSNTIDRVLGATRVYLRINVDPGVGRSALELVDHFKERGWLDSEAHIYPYLAPIGPMTEHCGFIGDSDKFRDFRTEFDELKDEFQKCISEHIDPRGIQHLQYYPMTKRMNCAAVGENSVVFGPDGLMYKCGLDVGIKARAHDALDANQPEPAQAKAKASPFTIVADDAVGSEAHPYSSYDPFSHDRCSECQYLPVCLGGCPKTHFEENEFYLERRSQYWEENFETLIRTLLRLGDPTFGSQPNVTSSGSGYSERSNRAGSIRLARHAGIAAASSAQAITSATAPRRVVGSSVVTPNSTPRSQRVPTVTASRPSTIPKSVSLEARNSTIRRTLCAAAPSAIRTPISCSRCCTAKAITA